MDYEKELINFIEGWNKIRKDQYCKKEGNPTVITVLGDFIKLADDSYYSLSRIESFDVDCSCVMAYGVNCGSALIYEADTTEEANKILNGLIKSLAERKYYHMNAIVERLERIECALREEL